MKHLEAKLFAKSNMKYIVNIEMDNFYEEIMLEFWSKQAKKHWFFFCLAKNTIKMKDFKKKVKKQKL